MPAPLSLRSSPPKPMALAMLQAANLPIEDLQDNSFEHFFYAASDGVPKGLVGLELYGSEALLRSLVVEERERGQGLGIALVEQAEKHAAEQGVRAIYLLTTHAESFFERLNYTRIARELAPLSIQRTREYSSICPQSSAFMVKKL